VAGTVLTSRRAFDARRAPFVCYGSARPALTAGISYGRPRQRVGAAGWPKVVIDQTLHAQP